MISCSSFTIGNLNYKSRFFISSIYFTSCIHFLKTGTKVIMSKEINKDPMPIFKNIELKYGIISIGLEMPSGTVINAPSLPERYSPREIDKNIMPMRVLAISFGASLETSEYTTGPRHISPISSKR